MNITKTSANTEPLEYVNKIKIVMMTFEENIRTLPNGLFTEEKSFIPRAIAKSGTCPIILRGRSLKSILCANG